MLGPPFEGLGLRELPAPALSRLGSRTMSSPAPNENTVPAQRGRETPLSSSCAGYKLIPGSSLLLMPGLLHPNHPRSPRSGLGATGAPQAFTAAHRLQLGSSSGPRLSLWAWQLSDRWQFWSPGALAQPFLPVIMPSPFLSALLASRCVLLALSLVSGPCPLPGSSRRPSF